MTISFTDSTAVIRNDDGIPFQFTNCTIRLTSREYHDITEYVNRFGLQHKAVDFILTHIFIMGLKEIKMQTNLDRYIDDQDVSE